MLNDLDIADLCGLSGKDAEKKLRDEGYNEVPNAKKRTFLAIAYSVVREPMFLLLVACGGIYFILGDVQEAIMLLGFVFVVMGITFYQERKTERTLEALRDLSSPRALVIRDGRRKRIPGREVVCGDILILAEGDRVPADAMLLAATSLSADESLLTGESVPVRKVAGNKETEIGRPGGDDLSSVYSGTLIVQGQGIARVHATGLRTEIGRIGRALQILEPEETPLKKETTQIVQRIALAGLSLCALVVVVFGATRGSWIDGILAGIAMEMAMLPEEFPVVLTVFLAIGAWRIAKHNVLTRNVPTIEALGAATVLCVDKTGTLTMNRMSARKIFADGIFCDISNYRVKHPPETFHDLLEFSILASQKDPFDPMEKAIRDFGIDYLAKTEHLHDDWTLVREYPLSRELLAMSHVWKSPEGGKFVIAAKGAPEVIADLCHLAGRQEEEVSSAVAALAEEGLRVLGIARAYFREETLPGGQHDFDFKFLGLIGLSDPVRPGVPEAIAECYRAGIRVVMITGDNPGTARNIAGQIGLRPLDKIVAGSVLTEMSDDDLQRTVRGANIFARMVPDQKLRLVSALKANFEIVAMTGDGVNDAPALKSAHIGIAMGERGTDVAREAADLVLLDDDFSSIVQAVQQGRRIFDNLMKAMSYIIAIHVPIAGMSLLPVLFGWPLVFLPVHIVFLELIIDPACSIAFEMEREEMDIMNRPPRNTGKRLFDTRMLLISFLQGLSVLGIVLAVFAVAMHRGQGEAEARALTFTTLIVANLGLIFTNRSWTRTILTTLRSPNSALWCVAVGALVFLGLVLYTPFLRTLFHFSFLHINDIIICIIAGIVSILWFEGFKMLEKRHCA